MDTVHPLSHPTSSSVRAATPRLSSLHFPLFLAHPSGFSVSRAEAEAVRMRGVVQGRFSSSSSLLLRNVSPLLWHMLSRRREREQCLRRALLSPRPRRCRAAAWRVVNRGSARCAPKREWRKEEPGLVNSPWIFPPLLLLLFCRLTFSFTSLPLPLRSSSLPSSSPLLLSFHFRFSSPLLSSPLFCFFPVEPIPLSFW
jgi:hypothetical protein